MPRPNVLFLMVDQMQAGVIAPGSQCLTPNIDRLSDEGVRFSRAYSVNAICSPTRASLLTGVMPSTHGMVDVIQNVPAYRANFDQSLETWTQRLKELGYTSGYYGKWHAERTGKLERFGFDEYEEHQGGHFGEHFSRRFAAYREEMGLSFKPERFSLRYAVHHEGYDDFLLYAVHDEPVESTDEYYLYSQGIDFIRRATEEGRPWFAFISTTAPGEACVVPEEHYRRYDVDSIDLPASFSDDLRDRPNIYRRMQAVWTQMQPRHFREARACYYAFCSLVDDQVGRILDYLQDSGQAEDTIVVFVGDHGRLMGAHRLMNTSVFPFEEVYRVPLIIRWPGAAINGSPCGHIVSSYSLGPTILDLVDGGTLPRSEAPSLVPLLRGQEEGWVDEAFAEFHGQRFGWTQRIVWRDKYKYVFNGFDYDELYDLENDPHELRNLAAEPEYQAVLKELACRMWARIEKAGDTHLHKAHYGPLRILPVGPNRARGPACDG